ncbi:MAG: hypothetical protein H6Q73_1921 [Firmicutes bacterium]|nr:hypothetical protein [Bacillota bacterium]
MANWYGYILVIIAAAIFGASSIIAKYVYFTGLSPVPVLIMQGLLAMVIAWGWVIVSGKWVAIPKSLIFSLMTQGIIGSFLTTVLFYSALGSMSASLVTLLFFTYPAFVLIYNVLLNGHQVTRAEKVALVMASVGLVFCVDLPKIGLGEVDVWAAMMAVGAAITNAYLIINGEKLLEKISLPVVTAWTQTISLVMLLVIYQPLWLVSISLSWYQVGLLAAGGIMNLLPLMIYLAGIRRVGAGIASIVSTAEIPFTLILAWVLLGETLNGMQTVGGLLIMLSVVILYCYRIE